MFNVDLYKNNLSDLLKKGFNFKSHNQLNNGNDIFLRHDIDFSIENALYIAEVENKLNIKSYYFFMLSSNTYNLLSEFNKNLVFKIKDLGHIISIHFDPKIYNDINKSFTKEKKTFDSFFSTDIDLVSIHRPGIFLKQNNHKLPKVRHTYEDRYFKKMNYLSDSGGRDITKQLRELKPNLESMPIHLLLHPIWWTSENNTVNSTLNSWISKKYNFLKEETRKNCKTFTD